MTHSAAINLNALGSAANWDALDAAGRRVMLTEILAHVSSEALQGETLEAVLQRIVDCIAQRLPVTIARIIMLDEEGEHFVQEVWSGHLALDLPGGLPWPVSIGVSGRCARTGQPQLISNVSGDPDYVPGNRDVKSEYLVPIRHRDRLHGVLNLESTSANFFTAEVCSVFDAIARQIAGAIHFARVVRDLEIANRKLRQLSMSDGLTGIANRRCFDERMALEWSQHALAGCPLALLLVDVDCFKPLNDARGHLHGDECLRELAGVCFRALRGHDDLVARYGGEEFALLLPGCDLRSARRVAERLRRGVESLALPHLTSPVEPYVTVSVGVSAVVPASAWSSDALIAAADRALYIGKARGRNRVVARLVSGDGFSTDRR
ncbi:MAG: diguanylate cyclase [Dokdonella sp.]|uniref:sensor domain-containing diguanylate cyclase n=1 Tax=Dokdonella sp. TaxID=2291710 RepID=UPI0032677433